MSRVVLGARRADNTIYQYDAVTNTWSASAIQSPGGAVGHGIWGVPKTGGLWVGEGIGKVYHYDGVGTWTLHNLPGGAINSCRCIVGADNGQHVYVGTGNFYGGGGPAFKRTGSGPFVSIAGGVAHSGAIWCDGTGQHVWIGHGSGNSGSQDLWYSDDYGASFSSMYAAALAVCAADGASPSDTLASGGIYGVSPTEVYVDVGRYQAWARVLLWDGAAFSVIARATGTVSFGHGSPGPTLGPQSVIHMGPGSLWRAATVDSTLTYDSRDVVPWPYQWNPLGSPGLCNYRGRLIAAFAGRASYGWGDSLYSDDDGATWALVNDPWGPYGVGRITTIDAMTIYGPASVDSLDGVPVTERGGHLLIATGTFVRGESLTVTIDGVPCYGEQGNGYSPVSDDGQTLRFVSPPLTVGGAKVLEIETAAGSLFGEVDVLERSWGSAEHEAHRSHPQWSAVGKRRLDLEDLIQ